METRLLHVEVIKLPPASDNRVQIETAAVVVVEYSWAGMVS
jgi:hypothetical protein